MFKNYEYPCTLYLYIIDFIIYYKYVCVVKTIKYFIFIIMPFKIYYICILKCLHDKHK